MAIISFIAVEGSTIWDVVDNTYGTVDKIVKLMEDNNFPNVNTYPVNGQIFLFDDTLVENQNILQSNIGVKKFATRDRQTTNEKNMVKYESVFGTEYTSNADGTTIIALGDALLGCRIVQIEREIKPMNQSDYAFNPVNAQLNLQNGQTIDAGMTLFIIYAKMILS